MCRALLWVNASIVNQSQEQHFHGTETTHKVYQKATDFPPARPVAGKITILPVTVQWYNALFQQMVAVIYRIQRVKSKHGEGARDLKTAWP